MTAILDGVHSIDEDVPPLKVPHIDWRFGVRMCICMAAIVGLTGVLSSASAARPQEEAVRVAIENFAPLWFPPAKTLRGWTIGIDPGPDTQEEGAPRQRADLNLLTAVHLYHSVIEGGGSPVLTRADETHFGGDTMTARVRAIALRQCDLLVSIRYDQGAAQILVQRVPDTTPADAALADALLAALNAAPARTVQAVALAESIRSESSGAPLPSVAVLVPTEHRTGGITPEMRFACRQLSQQLYEGISQFVAAQKPKKGAPERPAPVPDCPDAPHGTKVARIARAIWPAGNLPADRINWFCGMYELKAITNRSLVYFDISGETVDGKTVLRGASNRPAIVESLADALKVVGVCDIQIDVRSLPDADTLGNGPFGMCRVPAALTFYKPAGGSLQSQILFGEPLFLLDQQTVQHQDYFLCHAGDGYWGWVSSDAVEPLTAEQFDAYMQMPEAGVTRDLNVGEWRVPRGSRVRVAVLKTGEPAIRMPDAKVVVVPADALTREREKVTGAARVAAALELLYTPYVFGGRSPLGLDCSGLITNVLPRTGCDFPARDASQQVLAGKLVATRRHMGSLQPGDQIYFIDVRGKVYHVGFALGDNYFVHSSPPCVQISSFDPADPLYAPDYHEAFFVAKRP